MGLKATVRTIGNKILKAVDLVPKRIGSKNCGKDHIQEDFSNHFWCFCIDVIDKTKFSTNYILECHVNFSKVNSSTTSPQIIVRSHGAVQSSRVLTYFCYLPNSALLSATEGAARIFP